MKFLLRVLVLPLLRRMVRRRWTRWHRWLDRLAERITK